MVTRDFPEVALVPMEANYGGAGGFHAGFKLAFEQGYSWIWAMDDDGYPLSGSLRELLNAETTSRFRGPLVVSEGSNDGKLAFTWIQRHRELHALQEVEAVTSRGLIFGHVCPFNGVLVHRDVVEAIGLPKPEFFFWGDEWDFFHRAEAEGFEPVTVTQARFSHPEDRTKRKRFSVLNHQVTVMYGDTPFTNYLLIRNHAYIRMKHFGARAWLSHTTKYIFFFTFLSTGVGPIQVLMYALEGASGKLGGHKRFLQ